MRHVRSSRALILAALFAATAAPSLALAQELLTNGGFDAGVAGDLGAPGWTTYNQTFTSGEYARTNGGLSFKAYGPFFTVGAGSVGLQSVPAAPGESFNLSGYMFSPTNDFVKGSNVGILELHFLDAGNAVIAGSAQQATFTAASTPDAWLPYTINLTAPANAVKAEVVIGHIQLSNPFQGGAVFWDDLSLTKVVLPSESVWISTGGGAWGDGPNWQAGLVPNAPGATANFGSSIAAPSSVTLVAPATVGTIKFNNANSYTVGGASTLTLDVATGSASIQVTTGSHAINAPLALADSTVVAASAGTTLSIGGSLSLANGAQLSSSGAGTTRIASTATVTGSAGASVRANGGTFELNADLGPSVDVVADAGSLVLGSSQHVRSLTVNGSATVANGAAARFVVTPTLVLGASGALDLTDNVLVVDYAPGATGTLAAVRASVVAGLAGPTGLRTSLASPSRTIGLAEASVAAPSGDYRGQSVDGSAVIAALTAPGDTNLDLTVNFPDLLNLAQAYGTTTGATWSQGDSNYDGAVSFPDLLALAQNYNTTVTGTFAGDWSLAQSLVPEPTSLAALTAVLGAALRRRRR